MYAMWPGCYCFRDELKMFALWLKEQTEALVLKIYEIDRLMNGEADINFLQNSLSFLKYLSLLSASFYFFCSCNIIFL